MISDKLKSALLGAAARLMGLFPLRWLHTAAIPINCLLGWLPLAKHAVVERNLQACFPDQTDSERRKLAAAQRLELVRLMLELGPLATWPGERLEAHLHGYEGWEHVQQALKKGRGVIMVTGHFGNWEILNLAVSRRLDLVTLYRAPDQPWLDQFISRIRCRFGGRVVPSGSAAMRQLLRQLRNGGAVAIAADIQPKRGEGVFVPFMGVPALTMTLLQRLARKTGCEVIFCEALRAGRGRGWSLTFRAAPESITEPDATIAMGAYNDWLSARVRAEPKQYLWIYKRFSRRPDPTEGRFYPKSR